ncbi:hypothetical protein COBT_002206, partial [Conglomerata obtusa]
MNRLPEYLNTVHASSLVQHTAQPILHLLPINPLNYDPFTHFVSVHDERVKEAINVEVKRRLRHKVYNDRNKEIKNLRRSEYVSNDCKQFESNDFLNQSNKNISQSCINNKSNINALDQSKCNNESNDNKSCKFNNAENINKNNTNFNEQESFYDKECDTKNNEQNIFNTEMQSLQMEENELTQRNVSHDQERINLERNAQERISHQITELGQIVCDITVQVEAQGERLRRIDDAVDDTEDYLKRSYYEINRLWNR